MRRPARARRRRDDSVAGARGRGDTRRRARQRGDVPRRGGRRAPDPFTVPGTAFKVELAEAHDRRGSCRPSRSRRHDHRHAARAAHRRSRRPGRRAAQGDRRRALPVGLHVPGARHMPRWCSPPSRREPITRIDTARARGRARGARRDHPRERAALAEAPTTRSARRPRSRSGTTASCTTASTWPMVVADTREQARAAARLVAVDYEATAPVLRHRGPGAAGVARSTWRLDIDRGDVGAALAVRRRGRTTSASRPRRRPTTRWACSPPSRRWDGDRLIVHDSTQWPDAWTRRPLATVFERAEERRAGARAVHRWRVRRRTARLAARDPDRARGTDRRPPGQAGADPAADVHLHRPPAGDACNGCGSARPATAGSSPIDHEGTSTLGDRGRTTSIRSRGHRQRLRLRERLDPRPAGAAEHPEPALRCAAPGTAEGNFALESALDELSYAARHRPDRAAVAQLRRSCIRSRVCRGRARRCASATGSAPNGSAGRGATPRSGRCATATG